MKKILLLLLGLLGIVSVIYFNLGPDNKSRLSTSLVSEQKIESLKKDAQNISIARAFKLLRVKKDKDALVIFENILAKEPDNLDALWGKAEALRRSYHYKEAEDILNEVLKKEPKHISSLISLSYIRYKEDRLDDTILLVKNILSANAISKDNKALAYMILGMINARRALKGGLVAKIKYAGRIKDYFIAAKKIAPDLSEPHLALGTFYLQAPVIIGGSPEEALKELLLAVQLAPDFATANARLAQSYKKKGNLERYGFYIKRAEKLDPENEVVLSENTQKE